MANDKIPGGYILLSRKVVESEIMKKPPLYLKVWVWLLLKAQHKEYAGLARGQGRTSVSEIAEAMSYKVGFRVETPSQKEIRGIVGWLTRNPYEGHYEGHMMVTTKVTHGFVYTICNYDVYQTPENYEGQYEGHTKVARRSEQGRNINKNVKNDNNKELLNNSMSDVPPDEPKLKYNPDADPSNSYYKAAQHFREMVLNANPTCKVPKDGTEGMIGWTRTIRLMFEADKRDKIHVRETLDFCFKKDAFWMHTCQSPASFRRNYDKIRGKMVGEQKQSNGQSSFGRSMDKVLAWVPPDER